MNKPESVIHSVIAQKGSVEYDVEIIVSEVWRENRRVDLAITNSIATRVKSKRLSLDDGFVK